MASVLKTQYNKEIVPALQKELGLKNVMEVPKVKSVTVNVGYGRQVKDNAFIENVEKTLAQITGQKPVRTKASKSISNFKLREGMEIGAMVTLRDDAMYEFLYRLVNLTFPRVRDFRGISIKGFDRQGNFSVGFKENTSFPEVTAESNDKIHGLQVVIATTAKNKKEGVLLLKHLGFPFKDADKIS